MNIGELAANLSSYRARLDEARRRCPPSIAWYPYDILANLSHLDQLLTGSYRDLSLLAGDLPVADIGGADGDLAFTLERECGWEIDVIDTAGTNNNGLQAARALARQLGSSVQVHDINLDDQFQLPRERYGLVLLLGILYHLKNPFFVLQRLSAHTRYCLLSTRVARYAGPERTEIAALPVAYLVGPSETNGDPTNYWMFSPEGLERIVARSGWKVLERTSLGDIEQSDPSSMDRDERRFMLLESSSPAL